VINSGAISGDQMPTITLKITIEVPPGLDVNVSTEGADQPSASSDNVVPEDIVDTVRRLVPTRYLKWTELYLERCVSELGCTVEFPGGDRDDYVNVFAPPRCRRARVSGITYSSSRTAVYAEPIDVSSFRYAQETMNGGRYAYPKLPHLDSAEAVDEAIELTKLAIKRFER
jgi:hypothetical protein